MTDIKKLKKVKNETIVWVIILISYCLLILYALGSLIFFNTDAETNVLIGMYTVIFFLLFTTVILLFKNLSILRSEDKLRKKAIQKYDERNSDIRLKSNNVTFVIILLSLILTIIISIFLDNVMVFTMTVLLLLLIVAIRLVVGIVYRKIC